MQSQHSLVGKNSFFCRYFFGQLTPLISSFHILFAFLILLPNTAPAWVIDDTSTVTLKDNEQYGAGQQTVGFNVVNISDSIPLGAIGCVGICVGLEAEAGGHAKVNANFSVGFNNTVDLLAKANTRTFIFGADTAPEVGSSFHLINRIESQGIDKLNINAGNYWASSSLDINIGAFARAEACLVLCINGDFSVGANLGLQLAGISNSGLSLLGKHVDSSSPYSYTEPSGLYGASAGIPKFSKTFTNLAPGQAANLSLPPQQMLNAWVDVAEVIARAFGLPPLEGSALGFDYELLSLNLFAGLNLQHSFNLNVLDVQTSYKFSSPVQVFDSASNSWSDPVWALILGDKEAVTLRSEDAASLGIIRTPRYIYQIDWDYDLILNAGAELDAIAVNGYGLNIGPLLNPDPWKVDLKKFNLGSKTETHVLLQQDNNLNINFNLTRVIPGDETTPTTEISLCALLPDGCQQAGYVAVRTDLGAGIMEETVWRVFNFGVPGCGENEITDCDIDFSVLPQITRYRVKNIPDAYSLGIDLADFSDNALLLGVLAELGIDPSSTLPLSQLLEYADDFEAIDAFLAEDPLLGGPASSDEQLLAALTALGVDLDNPFPKQPLGSGAPKLTQPLTEEVSFAITAQVAEPADLTLYLLGLTTLLLARRKRH